MKRPLRAALVCSAVVLVLLALAELAFRGLAGAELQTQVQNLRRYLLTGMMRDYEARAYTVYQRPRRGSSSNSYGFSDAQWIRERTPGVPRIVCLGGSTTEGGNAKGRLGSYPGLLEVALEERTGRDFEVMNAGISGWTTNEMLVTWFLTIADFDPDVVVLHEAVNDLEPRFMANYQPDYSHWRTPVTTQPARGLKRLLVGASELYVWLRLRNAPAPQILDVCSNRSGPKEPLMAEGKLPHATSLSFRRNMRAIGRAARADGATVVLMTLPSGPNASIGEFWRYGIHENNQHLRELAAEEGFLLADAERVFESRPELAAEFSDMVHLEPPGNQVKAEALADALAGWVAGLSPEGARAPQKPR